MRLSIKLIPCLCGILLAGCLQNYELQERPYPRLETNEVDILDDEYVRFNASFIRRGDEQITSYGFVWSFLSAPTLDNPGTARIQVEGNITDEEFSLEIGSSFRSIETYLIRSFVVTDQYTVYGTTKQFRVTESGVPLLSSIEPNSSERLQEVLLRGEYFNYQPSENIVYFNSSRVSVLEASDTTLLVYLPNSLLPGNKNVSVKIFGATSNTLQFTVLE